MNNNANEFWFTCLITVMLDIIEFDLQLSNNYISDQLILTHEEQEVCVKLGEYVKGWTMINVLLLSKMIG